MVGTIANLLVVAWLVGMAARLYSRVSAASSQRMTAQMQRLMLERAREEARKNAGGETGDRAGRA